METEFIGCNFQELIQGIEGKLTAVKNLQANSLVKWLHGPFGDQLRTMVFEEVELIYNLTIYLGSNFVFKA